MHLCISTMLHVFYTFLLFLSAPAYTMAATYIYENDDGFANIVHPCPTPSLLWSCLSSSIWFGMIGCTIMLLISPRTRFLTLQGLGLIHVFLGNMRYLIATLAQVAFKLRGASPEAFTRLKHAHAEEIARKDCAFEQSEIIRKHIVQINERIIQESEQLKADISQLQSEVRSKEDRLREVLDGAPGPDARIRRCEREAREQENVELRKQVADRDKKLAKKSWEVSSLKNQLSGVQEDLEDEREAHDKSLRTIEAGVRREERLKETIEASNKEIKENNEEHREQLASKDKEHQNQLYAKDMRLSLLERLPELLCAISEGGGHELAAAVIFAKILQLNNINLGFIGIDSGRLELLFDFVNNFQDPSLPIQPQAFERGFRLGKRPTASTTVALPTYKSVDAPTCVPDVVKALPAAPTNNGKKASSRSASETRPLKRSCPDSFRSSQTMSSGIQEQSQDLPPQQLISWPSSGLVHDGSYSNTSSLGSSEQQSSPAFGPSLGAPSVDTQSTSGNSSFGSSTQQQFGSSFSASVSCGSYSSPFAAAVQNLNRSQQPSVGGSNVPLDPSPFAALGAACSKRSTFASPNNLGSCGFGSNASSTPSPFAALASAPRLTFASSSNSGFSGFGSSINNDISDNIFMKASMGSKSSSSSGRQDYRGRTRDDIEDL